MLGGHVLDTNLGADIVYCFMCWLVYECHVLGANLDENGLSYQPFTRTPTRARSHHRSLLEGPHSRLRALRTYGAGS